MFKSKIFNSVMRYMLVAMLALLPNAIWGENVFLNDVHKVNINLCDIMWKNNAFAYDYALIYFKDKDGNQVSLDNFGLARWGKTSPDGVPNDYTDGGVKKSGNYYMFSQKVYKWGDKENLFNFTFSNDKLDLSGYQIIFKASNSNDFESDKETADITITYQLYSQSNIDAVTFTKATDPTSVKSAYALKEGNKCIFSGASIYDEIKSILGVSSKEDIKDFYIRWTIKHTDDTKVDNLTVSSGKIQKRNDVDYIYFNNTGSSIQAKDLDVTLKLPSDESWDNIKLSFVISKNISELTTKYGVVEKEPTLNALYNITLETKYSMPFNHYVGHANTAFENGMQQTAEWEYYVYVKDANEKVELVLPFDEYENSGKDLEPQGYFRWYDLKTDLASNNLRQNSGTKPTLLNSIISGGKNYGLFAYKLQKADKPCSDNIGVTYTAPAEASSEGWAGEDIACDVSRYIDGLDATKTYLVHEPTLSIRYIFHIRSAKKLADDIMNTAIGKNLERAGYRTYEDGKYITVGMKDKSSSVVTLRLDLSDAKKYYFHPLADGIYKKNGSSEGFTHRVYYVDEKDKLVESNFDKNKLCKATKIEWWAYDKTKTYCRNLGTTDKRFFDLTMENLGKLPWASVSMDGSSKSFTFEYGDPVFIVAYAMDDDENRCPIANFDVRFMNNHPMTKEEIVKNGLNNRLISYLDEHYKMATKPITFDDDDVEQTVSAPTSPDDNQDRLPSKWDRRAYSFVYRDLIDCDASWWVNLGEIGHSPLHGDYCLYKSANVNGISGNGETLKDGYLWWQSGQLYDKTYEITNGSQYGHFLYVDASDESRKIAAADFTADLCTGQQLIFTAGVADMTKADTKPQIMFKLFGVKRNVNDDIVEKHLIHSFASGDFKTNVEDLKPATWYQVYGKITLQKESNVEQFSDFRLEIDNYCSNTDGADYAVDDIRMYLAPAKVQVIQEKPVCNGATTGTIKLKIRAIHETLNAILGHNDTKIYFRFVGEDGKPVTGDGFYSYTLTDKKNGTKNNVSGSEYGTVNVYDSEETCKNFDIDGTNMIEQDSEGETYIVISNKEFPLTTGKKYYVSVSTEDPAKGNANWGTPAEVCSLYSNWFEMVSQHPIITDVKGNVVTDYKIPCDQADNYEVKIKGQLTTTDPNNGGKITLDNVKFYWYLNDIHKDNKLNETASNEIIISKDKLPLGKTHKIYMQPEGTPNEDGYIPYTINGTTYLLCTGAIPVDLRVMKDGPQLNFGFNDVDYPFNDGSYEASLRIGLPQLEKLKASKGYLKVPLHSATMRDGTAITEPLTFIDDSKVPAVNSKSVIVASTNDPLWETKLNTQVATLENEELPAFDKTTQATLNLKFEDDAVANFHEGYYYVLRFAFEKRAASEGTTNCPGESYLKVKIVPEFITWTPTADGGMNANWNNDANWHRSSSAELYDDDYTDYQTYGSTISAAASASKIDIPTQNSYVPMKFTKVTIGNLNGLPFPDLGNVVYRSTNQIATKLTNGKGNEATKYIQYDIMAFWNEADANKGFGTDGNLKCEKFYGNTCHQIYFKPQGELRDQCYLVYDKAWVEKELEPNKWYTMASPLQYIYAGDMYVPAKDGRQETKAFTDITFDTNVYSRSKYPVYQRAWMKSDVKEITPKSDYPASHYPSVAAPENVDMNLGYWSHVYNRVDESYAADGTFGGFSIKAGNALLPKDKTKKALLRLPKADTEYQYFDYNGNENSSSKTRVAKDAGHGKFLVAYSNEEKTFVEKTQALGTDNASGFYLVANPYTCSISMAKFFEANTGLQKAIWMVENGEVKAISNAELDKQNYAIQPTQSFFVKKKGGEMVENVRFTSAMYVDRTITPGLLMASDYVKSVEATTENSSGQISKARIALRPEASADYDDQEDVDLLYDQNLKDVPQVYTVAGNEAVAVNAVPELSWIPLGIVSQQAEEVSLTLKGVNKLDAPVYLYDAASASFTEVHEGEAVKVKAGDHGRYFLTQTRTSTGIDRMEAEEQSAPVKVYSPVAGMIVVSALGSEKLDRVQVFTLDGKMVHSYQLPDKQRMILRVPSGIYIVKASTQSCAQAKGQKIAVR